MADPLRRTILAKLRGKKSKKGTPAGGGYGSAAAAAAAAANGDREGNVKVLQQQQNFEARSVFLLTGLDGMTQRMSTYENFDSSGAIEVGGFLVRDNRGGVLASAFPHYEVATACVNTSSEGEQVGRGGDRVNEELPGVPLQRENGRDTIHQGPCSPGRVLLAVGEHVGDSHAPKKQLSRQYSVGDSIGFGGNDNHVYHTRFESNAEVVATARISALGIENVRLEKDARVHAYRRDRCFRVRHVAESVVGVNERAHQSDSNVDSARPINATPATCATLMYPTCVPGYCLAGSNTEETILIRNIESYDRSNEYSSDIRLMNLQSPTYFPTESEINMASLCAREASPIRHSLDSEDEDYYDNEILPFYEAVRPGASDSCVSNLEVQSGKDKGQLRDIGVQETDRLRSQLKEAYYLLINAMHDINLDVQQHSGGLTKQQTYSSCSSPSRDSLCSRLSAKNVDSDSWSSGGEHSPQQVSDSDSNLLCLGANFVSTRRSELRCCKSMANLSVTNTRAGIPRSASDAAIRYHGRGPAVCEEASGAQSPEVCAGDLAMEPKGPQEEKGVHVREASEPPECQSADAEITSSNERLQDASGEDEDGGGLNESGGSAGSLTGSSDNNGDAASNVPGRCQREDPSGPRSLAATCALARQGPRVTVNKMQEWMHKGRLLSSEMKQRIEGSSSSSSSSPSSPRGSQRQDKFPPQGNPAGCKMADQGPVRGVKSLSPSRGGLLAPRSPGQLTTSSAPQQPAVSIENVQGPYANGREFGRANEPSVWRPPLNSITVSKKRNWLQQSSLGKAHGAKDEPHGILGAEEECGQGPHHQPPFPPSSSPDPLRPPGVAPSLPLRLHLPQVCVGHVRVAPATRCVDPAEENDADDEGEIWYNPIPEDDEPEVPNNNRASVRLLAPPRHESQAPKRRPVKVWDAGRGSCRVPEAANNPRPEGLREGGGVACGGGGGDRSLGNATHSTEAPHLHRQMLACKPQEEGGASSSRASDGCDLPHAAGFSPPSSPNPAKKSGSLNWSFPDKIKSPRTVRKISMKMKKLPELSRKLSVKGNPSNANSSHGNGSGQSETRAHSFRMTSARPEAVSKTSGPPGGGQVAAASRNVISRYHLDSSVSTQHSFSKKKNSGGSKSANKGGYLSDGDSPELVAKSGKHGCAEGKGGKYKESAPGSGGEKTGAVVTGGGGGASPKLHGTELDIDAFRHYSFTEQPKCSQFISGLMSLHFYGAEDLKPPRADSRDVYCAIQVDSVNKARTALLTCRTSFLDMDHTFNIELENAQHLKLVVFSWEPTPKRTRVCCHGTVVLPALFRVTRSHQLAVKLEPRGLIYVKLGLMEHWKNSLDGGADGGRERQVFGVEAWRVVEKENTGLLVPLLIHKCIAEIEKRGCQVVGLYRLCGSAAVKKELREAFERDGNAAQLCENTYPDINVITGVLKDYLRELPYPLITKQLYEAVLESMARRPLRIGAAGCENDPADGEHTVSLLEILPEVERVTLRKLLDHLKLVASHQEVNKMTCQNLAVCFGPVLLSQRQEASCHTNRVFIDSEELASALHFKKHIEVLHYLLQLWPVNSQGLASTTAGAAPTWTAAPAAPAPANTSSDLLGPPPLRRRKERPQVLNLSEAEMAGVLRPKPGRLDSPSNRYAGDWSGCGDRYFVPELPAPQSREEADYDDVPSGDTEAGREEGEEEEEEAQWKPEGKEEEREDGSDGVPEEVKDEEEEREKEGEKGEEEKGEEQVESDGSGSGRPPEREEEEEEVEEEEEEERLCDHILPPHLPKEHAYQAYVKIQDISPVLSNRVNLRDLQESIDTLIGNLERELNKNKLNVGY